MHRSVKDVPDRVKRFLQSDPDTQLSTLAELRRRSAYESGLAWSTVALLAGPGVAVLASLLIAAYSLWGQASIAYWQIQSALPNSGGVSDQMERWARALKEVPTAGNAEQLIGRWGSIVVVVLLATTATYVLIAHLLASRRAVATSWLQTFEQALIRQEAQAQVAKVSHPTRHARNRVTWWGIVSRRG